MSEQTKYVFIGASCRGYQGNRITEDTPLNVVVGRLVSLIEEVHENMTIQERRAGGMSALCQAAQDARFRLLGKRGA